MFIIHKGRGIAAPILAFAALVFVQLGVDRVLGAGYYTANEWPKNVALIVAAVTIWGTGRSWNRLRRLSLDCDSGEQLTFKPKHTLFWIPMEYWALPLLAWALVPYVATLGG
ncbi:MAG TPA: hypothetical protein VN493_08750 [Thermoanaerobaculia bacterium]|nr:hypothetical protein [Thermoanaerobaculia bacterium]